MEMGIHFDVLSSDFGLHGTSECWQCAAVNAWLLTAPLGRNHSDAFCVRAFLEGPRIGMSFNDSGFRYWVDFSTF